MKITIYEKNHARGCPIKPIFEINRVNYWRYEPVNDTIQVIIGDKYNEIGRLILNVEKIEFFVNECTNDSIDTLIENCEEGVR